MSEIVHTNREIQTMITIPLDQNPAAVYLARLTTENSRSGIRWCLNLAASILSSGQSDYLNLDWPKLRYPHIVALKAKLISPHPTPRREKPYSVGTANLALCAVKGVMKESWKLGLISDSIHLRITAEPNLRGESLPAGRALTTSEIEKLFDVCRKNGGVGGIRDTALLAIMLGAGLRRTEVSDLDLEDWDCEESLIVVRQGKGRRPREVPISKQVNRAISTWVDLRGKDEGPLFTQIHIGGSIYIKRLQPEAVYAILERRWIEAGIEKVSPHDLRRSYITNLLSNGNDLASVAKLAGHRSTDTTMLYDRRGLESLREAAESLELPC